MKFIKKDESGQGKTVCLFALGKEEARILLSLLDNAHKWTPWTFRTSPDKARVNNMRKEISNNLHRFPGSDTGYPKNEDRRGAV